MANVESMIVEEKTQIKQIDREKVCVSCSEAFKFSITIFYRQFNVFFFLRLVHYSYECSALRAAIIRCPSTCTEMCQPTNCRFTPGKMRRYTSWPLWCATLIRIHAKKAPTLTLPSCSQIIATIIFKCVRLELPAQDKKESTTTRRWPRPSLALAIFLTFPLPRRIACLLLGANDPTDQDYKLTASTGYFHIHSILSLHTRNNNKSK